MVRGGCDELPEHTLFLLKLFHRLVYDVLEISIEVAVLLFQLHRHQAFIGPFK